MKKRQRFILHLASYVLSFLMCAGTLSLTGELIFGSGNSIRSHPLFYLAAIVLAIPLNLFLISPSLRALYLRTVRKRLPANSVARSMRKYGGMLSSSGASVFMIKDDNALTVVNASPGFWSIIGRRNVPSASKRSVSLAEYIHPDDLETVRTAILGSDVVVPQLDFRIVRHDGSDGWCRIGGVKEELGRSGITVTNCIAVDISDFVSTENELQMERERYKQMLSNLGSAVWEYRIDKDELYFLNRHMTDGKFRRIRNYRTTVVRDGTVHPDHVEEFYSICSLLRGGEEEIISSELRMRNHSGNYYWYQVTGNAVKDSDGRILSYIGQIKQSDGQSAAAQSKSHKDYDALTHLPDRFAFESSVNALLRKRGRSSRGALFVINVDKFTRINTSLGRLFGDALLIELSEALKNMFPAGSAFCRVSGDEFAVYVENYESEEKIFELAGMVCGCVRHCFINTEQSEGVTCCAGVALFPNHGTSFEQLFFKADSALIYAKNRGSGNYYIYNAEIDSKLADLSYDHHHDEPAKPAPTSLSFRDDSLLSQAIDILFESRELSSSINLIISLLGRRFKLDRAYVIEISDDSKHTTITYRWHSEHLGEGKLENIIMPIDKGMQYIHCANRDEYFLCTDMKTFADGKPELAAYVDQYNVRSMLQCPIIDGNELLGCFSYIICRDDAAFNESDVSQILMITKIITGYLVRLRSKQDIDRITYRDKLTGAMNFTAFQMELEKLMESTTDRNYAIVYSDIDRFKFINEKYGYLAGDNILCSVAEIYRQNIREGEFFARVTADKFIALLKYSSNVELDSRINALHDSINHIRKTENTCYYLPVRSGVYRITPGDTSVSGMIDLANLARKSVKNIHISTVSYFNENMKSRLKRQKDIEQVMADALVREEFVVYYQPKFSLSNNSLAGAEALVRWIRPDSASIMRPDEFIPIFEDNGFVIELDFYVLERVCRKLRRDIDNHLPVLPISVNFSRTHIATEDLITRLHDCLRRYDIPPNLIEIEITESALIENEGYLADMITELHNIGLVVSMDDFGSGFSSLNLLKKLPVDVLKIDRNFFASDSATERERCIIENVVNMARALGIHVVSEGVETAEQANFLRSIKCDLAQGYLFSPPIDERSFERTYQNAD